MTTLGNSIVDLWQYLEKGGILMIPLFLCSILAFAILILKLMQLRHKKIIFPEIVSVIRSIENPEDINLAQRVCKEKKGSFANVILVALNNQHLPRDEQKEAIIDQGRQEVRILEQGLGALETITGISPLLGLLGTVLGMIDVFNEIVKTEVVQAAQLSDGISKALITTVVGLMIAIPALVAYNYLINKAEGLILEIEKYSNQLVRKFRLFNEQSK
jgi:biopolymer transport protein ExbB